MSVILYVIEQRIDKINDSLVYIGDSLPIGIMFGHRYCSILRMLYECVVKTHTHPQSHNHEVHIPQTALLLCDNEY